ncbi:MAG: hypothetical protein AAFN77_24645 [Planctomycetota bacterium]
MRQAKLRILLLLWLVAVCGCADTNRKPLEQLCKSIQKNVTSKFRPEIQKLNGQEKAITLFRDTSRDGYQTVQEFLRGKPQLTTPVLKQVQEYRDAEYEAWQHHDAVLRNGNFNLTPEEFDQGTQLCKTAALKFMAIGSK